MKRSDLQTGPDPAICGGAAAFRAAVSRSKAFFRGSRCLLPPEPVALDGGGLCAAAAKRGRGIAMSEELEQGMVDNE